MSIILGGSNHVQRSLEVEELVRARLKEFDSLLDIRWVPLVYLDDEGTKWDGRYALTSQWPQVDKRWELHQKGELGEPFDILGWFVQPDEHGNIHNGTRLPVDPASLLEHVLKFLSKADNTRISWRERMKKSIEHNAALRKKQDQAIVEETIDEMEHRFITYPGRGAAFKDTQSSTKTQGA